jgi:hypothetical protein
LAPLDRVAVTARVGLPRESRISSASSLRISGMAHAFPARRPSKASVHPVAFAQGRDTPSTLPRNRMRLSLSFVGEILAGARLPDRIPCQESSSARPDGESLDGQRLRVNSFTTYSPFVKRGSWGCQQNPVKSNVPKGHADPPFLKKRESSCLLHS